MTTPVVRLKKFSNEEIAKLLQIRKTDLPSVSKMIQLDTEQPEKRLRMNSDPNRSEAQQTDSESVSNSVQQDMEPPAKRIKISSASQMRKTKSESAIAMIEFSIDEVVWGKLKGHPHWPAKICKFEKNKFEIFWFNDYRKSTVYRSQLFKFNDSNVKAFSKVLKGGLEAAIKEAIVYGMASAK